MIKKFRSVIIIFFLSLHVYAQQDTLATATQKQESINPEKALAYIADQFTIAQPLSLEFTKLGAHDFTSKYQGESLPKGKIKQFEQVKVGANIHLLRKEKWLLGTTLNYRYTHTDAHYYGEGVSILPEIPFDGDFHHWLTTANFTYFSTLFGKNAIYTSSLMLGGSDKHVEKVSGLVMGALILKADQHTKLMVGLIVILDKGMDVPVFPSFSYERKFGEGWTFDMILPRSVYLKKLVFQNEGRLSLGTELDGTSLYLYNLKGQNKKYEYRRIDLYNGLRYEHAFGDFILTAKTGLEITPTGRLSEKGKSFRRPIYKTQHDPAFYFNIGVSVNPFSFFGQPRKP